jgi:hypothetical protein
MRGGGSVDGPAALVRWRLPSCRRELGKGGSAAEESQTGQEAKRCQRLRTAKGKTLAGAIGEVGIVYGMIEPLRGDVTPLGFAFRKPSGSTLHGLIPALLCRRKRANYPARPARNFRGRGCGYMPAWSLDRRTRTRRDAQSCHLSVWPVRSNKDDSDHNASVVQGQDSARHGPEYRQQTLPMMPTFPAGSRAQAGGSVDHRERLVCKRGFGIHDIIVGWQM